jgi:hypothetical protein
VLLIAEERTRRNELVEIPTAIPDHPAYHPIRTEQSTIATSSLDRTRRYQVLLGDVTLETSQTEPLSSTHLPSPFVCRSRISFILFPLCCDPSLRK